MRCSRHHLSALSTQEVAEAIWGLDGRLRAAASTYGFPGIRPHSGEHNPVRHFFVVWPDFKVLANIAVPLVSPEDYCVPLDLGWAVVLISKAQ